MDKDRKNITGIVVELMKNALQTNATSVNISFTEADEEIRTTNIPTFVVLILVNIS
ncbi:MAG TPA: hypothetical protein VFC74_06490 [Oscillospiraceae bacterium]|nr:hypothetical protein [Oscillospiraceae bacterium]